MIIEAIKKVFKSGTYIILSIAMMVTVFSLSILYQNFDLIDQIARNSSFFDLLKFVYGLLIHFDSNLGLYPSIIIVSISALFGINVSFLIYYLKLQKYRLEKRDVGGAALGLIFGVVGVGCASCGSILAISLLSMFGATGILTYLPFGGQEFGLIGIFILLFSIYQLSKKINAPLVC